MQLCLFPWRPFEYFGPDEDPLIPAGAKLIWSHLVRMCRKTGSCCVPHFWLARRLGCSVRSIVRWIGALVSAGWLAVEYRPRASVYRTITRSRKPAESTEAETVCCDNLADPNQFPLFISDSSKQTTFEANTPKAPAEPADETVARGLTGLSLRPGVRRNARELAMFSTFDFNPDAPKLSPEDTREHLRAWVYNGGTAKELFDIQDGSGWSEDELCAELKRIGDLAAATKKRASIAKALEVVDREHWIPKPLAEDGILAQLYKRIEQLEISTERAYAVIKRAILLVNEKEHLRPRSWGWFLGVLAKDGKAC